jgi:glutamate racemase
MGEGVKIIHQGPVVAERLQDYLYRHPDLSHKLLQGSERQFCFTSSAQVFAGLSQEFYGSPITAKQVKIG